MNPSLRRRLLLTLMFAVSVAWIVAALASYYDSQNEIEELFDAELAQSARVLLSMSGHELVEERIHGGETLPAHTYTEARGEPYSHKYEKMIAFQVWLDGDTLALRSDSAPATPLTQRQHGYADEVIDGQRWRIFAVHHDTLAIQVYVGEHYDVRGELAQDIVLRLLIPILITLPVLALLIWYGVSYAMQPLLKLASEVARCNPLHLDPLDDRQVPEEARPLTQSLNKLLARVQQVLVNERRFTADAAHELRTPLAGIKAQAQVAKEASDDAALRHALGKVAQGVDTASRMVQQLLTLARLDPETDLTHLAPVDLATITADTLADLANTALHKHIDLSLQATPPALVRGSADALAILITNLVDNAIRYTPAQGVVEVRVSEHDGTVALKIADSGPGIPAEEREHVMQRFYRAANATAPGSGLGLSIVYRIAELHRAQLNLSSSPHGGLQVEVIFSAPHSPLSKV